MSICVTRKTSGLLVTTVFSLATNTNKVSKRDTKTTNRCKRSKERKKDAKRGLVFV